MQSSAEKSVGSELDPEAVEEIVIYNERGQVRFRILAYVPGDDITPETLRGAAAKRRLRLLP